MIQIFEVGFMYESTVILVIKQEAQVPIAHMRKQFKSIYTCGFHNVD